jgi:hypothetical protein
MVEMVSPLLQLWVLSFLWRGMKLGDSYSKL